MEEYGYTPRDVARTIVQLADADPRVQDAVRFWWDTGSLDSPVVAGYSPQSLIDEGRFDSPIAALLMMDWLFRDEEVAVAALQRPVDHTRLH
jgi:hypothetical protein